MVAVDLDASFLRESSPPARVRIVEADVRRAALARSHFDAAHARYVLVHNADWAALVDAIVASLKPGGAVVLEEPDFTVAKAGSGSDSRAFERVNAAICAMFRDAGRNRRSASGCPPRWSHAGCASSGPRTALRSVAGAILSRS